MTGGSAQLCQDLREPLLRDSCTPSSGARRRVPDTALDPGHLHRTEGLDPERG